MQVAREKKDLDVLLVSYDLQLPRADRVTVVSRVGEFVQGRGWGLPVVIAEAGALDAINERFDLPGGIPVTLAFDKQGKLVDREDGPCDRARFEQLFANAR